MGLVKAVRLEDDSLRKIYSADTPAEDFGIFSEIKSLWDAKRQPPRIPAWSDFSFEDFDGYHGWLAVEDIISRKPFDTVFRLWGTRWVEAYEIELTGKRYLDSLGQYRSSTLPVFWEELCQTSNITVSVNSMGWLDHLHPYHGKHGRDIALPLSENGIEVDKYLTVLALE